MSLSRIKTWIEEVLTPDDLNAEFNNILNNPVSLISPLTGALDLDGQTITVDAAAATTFVSSSSCSWSFMSGAKSGTPATTGSVVNYSAQTFTDSATAGSGTATAYTAFAFQRPTLAATNASVTTTDAATFYIPNNVAAGTNETITNSWAIWVDAGNVRFDDDIYWRSGTGFAGILAHNNSAARTYTFPDSDGTVLFTSGALGTPTSGTLTNCTGYPGTSLTVIDAAGDYLVGTAADTAAREPAYATIAAHASTMDPWGTRVLLLTGGAVTFTDIADADYVGQQVKLIMNAAHIWTDGAVFDVQGGATYTTAAGDQVILTATAVDAFDVEIIPANGGVVSSKGRTPITLTAAQASTSGTSITFSSIPAGVKRITVMLVGVSTNGTSLPIVQIGDAGGPEATGYAGVVRSSASETALDTGFTVSQDASASQVLHGALTLTLMDAAAFTWVATGVFGRSDAADGSYVGGSKSLSAELTQVVVTTVNGTDAFDAGSISICYE